MKSLTKIAFFPLVLLLWAPSARAQTPPDGGAASALDGGAASAPEGGAAPMVSSGAADASLGGSPAPAPSNLGPSNTNLAPRPAPTPAQLASLRTLEEEVDYFLGRGQQYRASINGLLLREHDRQVGRLQRGFERQIAAERTAEGEARRRAIDVFLRFVELYPEDPERTPDVMFRLAELYYDEAAYANLEAQDRAQEQGLAPPPSDFRCSLVLYRTILARFQSYRLLDTTHYILGWVLKEMGHEDEGISSYRGLVCRNHFHYDLEHGFDLLAPLQPGADTPVACPRLFDILRQRVPQVITPPLSAGGAMGDAGVTPADPDAAAALQAAQAALAPTALGADTLPIPGDYQDCQAIPGANGQPSRFTGEVWYALGDYSFDTAHDDLGNAQAIAAYQQAMRASERRRPVVVAARPPTALQGSSGSGSIVTQPAAARAQFDENIEYGAFWSKALYKIGWAYFRMLNGYPQALRSFSYLLDYFDFVGIDQNNQGNRTDTLKWIGVIFTETEWGVGGGDDQTRCQAVVEQLAHPPAAARRPFECGGIMRVVSPWDPQALAAMRDPRQRPPPVPGRPTYIPQDRPWTTEALLELANDYFQQTLYYEAITLFRIFLAIDPLNYRAPSVAESIAIAYERQSQFDQAISARGRLAQYTEGTEWWNANNDHPDAQRRADGIARNSLHDTAIQHHRAASQLRQEANRHLLAARNPQNRATAASELQQAADAFRRADVEYQAAVLAYTQFIDNYPNDEAAYEFRYNRAEALFYSRRHQEASRAYADVRESNENDQYLAPAAFMAVKAMEVHVRTLALQGQLNPCLAVRAGIPAAELVNDSGQPLIDSAQAAQCLLLPTAPGANGQPGAVQTLPIPESVQGLMDARNAYRTRVPPPLDSVEALREVVQTDTANASNLPPFRSKFDFLNARTLYRFGHVTEAETEYRRILREHCQDQVVFTAVFQDMNNMLVAQNRQDDLEALSRETQQQRCVINPTEDPRVGILADARMRHAMDVFREAERAPQDQARELYERSAREMNDAVQANPSHPQAALATRQIALANERIGRFDTATQTYIRITQQYNNTRASGGAELTGDALTERINILEEANFRAAVNLERTFDFDNAIRYHNNVVSDPRFANALDHGAHVHDSLLSIATITSNLNRWDRAQQAWRDFLPRAANARERAEAEFRATEVPYRAGQWNEALRSFQNYLRQNPANGDNAQFRVQAQYQSALAYRRLNDETNYRRSLREVVAVFRQSGQQPGSPAAARAAEALYRDLDDQVTAFSRSTFTRGDAAALRAQIERFNAQLREIDNAAREVVALRGGEYSIGALTRQGEAHEHLATQESRIGDLIVTSRADEARFANVRANITRLRTLADRNERTNPDLAQRLRDQAQQIEDQLQTAMDEARAGVQRTFDQEAEAQRKLAIINYATAVHTARSQNIPTAFAARALERLRTEENQPLMQDALTHQNVFQYQPGMFDAEAPGVNASETRLVATPPVVPEAQAP